MKTPCISYCLVGAVLIGMKVMTMMASKTSKNFKHFIMKLDDNQKQIYKSVIKERINIYLQGMVLGIVIALFITYNSNMAKNNNICLFIVVALGINLLYYSLYPKSTYMLEHLHSQDQVKAWLNIYKEMKLRCKVGMILGFIGYLFLGAGWC
jgi:hypothetical protein